MVSSVKLKEVGLVRLQSASVNPERAWEKRPTPYLAD